MRYGYYATIKRTEDGYLGHFQDIQVEETHARSYMKLIKKLQNELSVILLGYYENNINLPNSTDVADIKTEADEFVTYIEIDLDMVLVRSKNEYVKKTVSIPRYLNLLGVKAKVNFSQLLTDALSLNLLEWSDNVMRKRRDEKKMKIATKIDFDKIDSDETLSEELLEFKTWPAMTKHLVIKKRDTDGGIYYIFRYLDGKAVMNWNPNDYDIAEQQIYIGDIPIVMELPDEPGDYTHISESYRYDGDDD